MLDYLKTNFAQHRQTLIGHTVDWFDALRAQSLDNFMRLGLPTRKHEAWHYTNIAPRLTAPLNFASAEPRVLSADSRRSIAQALADVVGNTIVFIDGQYAPAYTRTEGLPDGVVLIPISTALKQKQHADRLKPYLLQTKPAAIRANYPFCDLNTALMSDGLFLYLPANARVERPINLVHLATSPVSATQDPVQLNTLQHIVVADAGAEATLFEMHRPVLPPAPTAPLNYFSNLRLKVHLAPGAIIHRYKLQNDSEQALHISHTELALRDNSQFHGYYYNVGAGLCREEIHANLSGAESHCRLSGLSVLNGAQQVDHDLLIEHAQPQGKSEQLYKSIMGGKAAGTFSGKVVVHPQAVKTEAKQTNKNLLLSDKASANARPMLEIYADDVQCTHGATVGQIDANKLFYLRARGIPKAEALTMLTRGFASDMLAQIKEPSINAHVEAVLAQKLPALNLQED